MSTHGKKGVGLPPVGRPGSGHTPNAEVTKSAKKLAPVSGTASSARKPVVSVQKYQELEEELQSQKDELAKREEYMRGVQRNYATLAKICAKNIEEIHDLKNDLQDTRLKYEDLSKQEESFLAMQEKYKEAQALIAKQKADYKESEDHNKSLTSKCYDYQSHIADLNEIKEELSAQLARIQALASTRKDEIRELQSSLRRHKQENLVERLNQEVSTLQQSHREALDEVEYQKSQVKAANTGLQKVNNQLKRATMDRDDYQDTITRLRGQNNIWKDQLDSIKKKMAEDSAKHESLKLDYDACATEMKALQRANPELQEKLNFSEKARAALQIQFDNLWREKVTLDIEKKEGNDRIHLLNLQLDKSKSERTKDKEQMDRQISLAMSGKTSLVEAQFDLERRAANAEKESRKAVEEISKLQGKNQTLRKDKTMQDQELARLKEELEVKEQELLRLSARLDMTTSDKPKKSPAEEVLQDTADSGQVRQLRKEADFFKQQLKTLQQQHNTVNNEFAEARRELSALYKKVKGLEAEQLEASKRSDKQREDYMNRTKEEFTQKLESLQSSSSELSRKLIHEQQKRAELQAALDRKPKEDPMNREALRRKEKELQAAVAKLIISEEASEASFTCIHCMKLYSNPATCIPCGHSFCTACVEGLGYCSQCGPEMKITFYPNELLDDLSSKFVFRKQSLAGLKRMSYKLTADTW